ncbi:MAG TPA: cell division topological specificity factor MinE [Thiotrichales bacterium]|nr:cell division topological specificity factor MinE [Thiotrichales bacterium]
MSFIDYFRRNRRKSASVAKERLQIILAREHADRDGPDFLPELKRELLEVVSRYVEIDLDQVNVTLERDGDYEVLELNVLLPDPSPRKRAAP